MRNLLALVGLVVVGFAGAGWYFGWYKPSVDMKDPNHPQFNVEIESNKIRQDLQKGVKSVGGAVQQEVKGVLTSQPVVPSELPVLPPPPPPQFDPGQTVPPVTIPLPPPPSLPPLK